MDRFNSNEIYESSKDDEVIFQEGVQARKACYPISENPYNFSISSSIIDTHKRNVWAAGWADWDMVVNSR